MTLFHDLDKDTQNAIKWFAAEFKYLKELKEDLEKLKKDSSISDQERDYKKIRHAWYYIGRCERRAERKIELVIRDLKRLIETNPNLVTLEKQIEISSEKLLKAFSFYTGDFKKKLVNILVDLRIKNRSRESELDMKKTASEAEQYVDSLIVWVGGLEVSLKNIYVNPIKSKNDDGLDKSNQEKIDFIRSKQEFQKRYVHYENIPGGDITFYRRTGEKTGSERVTGAIPVIDVRGRKVIFISDLHMYLWALRELMVLLQIIRKHRNDIIILGGDMYEGGKFSSQHIQAIIDKGKSLGKERKKQTREDRACIAFSLIHKMLRRVDTIMLPGNHDDEHWLGSFKDNYPKFFAKVIKLRTHHGDILVEHGDRIYRHWDQSFFSGAKNIPNVVLRGNVIMDEIGTALGGDKYIKFGSEMIYDSYKSVLTQLKQIYNVDKVILGHSHFIKFDDPKGLYMYGFKPTGRVNAFVIDEQGIIGMESYTSNAVYLAKEKIKSWLGINKD